MEDDVKFEQEYDRGMTPVIVGKAYVQMTSKLTDGRYVYDGHYKRVTGTVEKWEVRFSPPLSGDELVEVSAIDWPDRYCETYLFSLLPGGRNPLHELDGSATGYADPERLIRELGYEVDWTEFSGRDERWVRTEEPEEPGLWARAARKLVQTVFPGLMSRA